MVKKVLITSVDKDKGSGGNKAKKDIKYFLKRDLGFQTFDMSIDGTSKFYKYYFVNTKLRYFLKNEKPEILFFQYPNANFYVMEKLVSMYYKYVPDGKLYFIVHDIMGWQFAHRTEILNLEIQLFNRINGLVIHNESMEKFLVDRGVKVKMSQLGIFDYENKAPFNQFAYDKTVCFPGNLGKSTFLEKLQTNVKINLYGSNKASSYPQNLKYCGNYSADKIAGVLRESFGLVWDGGSPNTCEGSLGEYLKINDPHKASLYISAGIPVIVWKESALAKFIIKEKIGFTVSSLSELELRINSISSDEYASMRKRVRSIGEKVRTGYFIEKAVNNLLS